MTCSQLSCQLRALHRYRRGQGFESRTSLVLFSGFLFVTATVAYNCDVHSAVHIYDFHIFKTPIYFLFYSFVYFFIALSYGSVALSYIFFQKHSFKLHVASVYRVACCCVLLGVVAQSLEAVKRWHLALQGCGM